MRKARFAYSTLFGLMALVLPSIALAQSTISGVVKDTSGAVIPNAKVEASSEVLIERVRAVTTNGEGRYAIVDLRPGTYTVTVSVAGFATTKQQIEVPANVTVPVDAELRAGSVGETVTVEARVATVDVENAAHPTTLTRSEMDDLPTGRYMQSINSYVPGAHLNLPDIGGSQQIEQNYISVHGNGSVHDSYYLDGMKVNTTYADGQIQQYIDNAAIQETTSQASNVTAEASGGGMFTNLVPKDGGNQYHASFFGGLSGGSNFWQGNNLDSSTLARGLSGQDKTIKIEDFDGAFTGPIIHDKLWFALTGRDQQTYTQAGASRYPDGTPGIQDGHLYNGTFRLTYQQNAKNKFSAFILRNWKWKGHEILDGGQGGYLPADPSVAATQRNKWPMYYILQTRWTGTLTPRLIVEAGVSISHLDYNDWYQDGILQPAGTDAFYAGTSQVDTGTLRRYIAGAGQTYYQTTRNNYSGTAIYVTGSHQIKVGAEFNNGRNDNSTLLNGDGFSVFTNGVPTSFTAYNTPYEVHTHLAMDAGLFAMDTWHYKRLSITAGIRWEYLAARVDPENEPAGRFAPARTVAQIDCGTIKGMGCWKDWTPRLGVVYDLFGNHKTALKAGFGKYNSQYSSGFTGTFNPVAQVTESLFWNVNTDPTKGPVLNPAIPGQNCATTTFAGIVAPNPNCYPVGGFAPQGTPTSAVAPGHLGASPNPTFGSTGSTTGVNLDPNWHRDYNYQYTAGIQQELHKGITLNFGWFRRSSYQQFFLVNENGIDASNWTPFNIVNPLSGAPITVFNLSPTVKSLPTASLLETNAPQSLTRNVYTGFETQVVARLPRNMFVSFGWTMDRQLDRNCAENVSVGKPLADPNTLRYCDTFGDSSLAFQGINVSSLGKVSPPWAQAFTAQAVVPIYKGFVSSLSFLSNNYQGNFTGAGGSGTLNNGYLARTISIASAAGSVYPNGSIGVAPAGTPCSAGPAVGCPIDPGYNALQGGETINLVAPGQVRTPRLNQLDLSLKRTFKFRERFVIEPEFQVFNLLNTNAAVVQATALSASYPLDKNGKPTSAGVAPFLTSSQCSGSTVGSFANCGLGGAITTITNPRLLKVALLFRF
ncbi:MAG TPA: carboxypeptidase regulatory-like domain-containing protein [Bryobacteraceae bacterium]|nr:carboxypeptidase regulatory-like domain-containing protein [Bryobacteraceae bacterium]